MAPLGSPSPHILKVRIQPSQGCDGGSNPPGGIEDKGKTERRIEMGYYTNYRLEMVVRGDAKNIWVPQCTHAIILGAAFCHECGAKIGKRNILEVINEHIGADRQFYAVHEGAEATKWYRHDEDMLNLSREFPKVLFTLHGEGEEGGDLWRTYYLDGRLQKEKAVVAYAKFDLAKLKEV